MSITGEINSELYRQMMNLQEKLRQSEAERTRLEEMYNILIRTFKEEEEVRLKNVENRYQSFLEDCARRSYRNEKILRSVERVESGANVLHAKTERLKLLRNHYEAYLERTIPAWRQPLLQYGPSQLPSTQEMEWGRRDQMIREKISESNNRNFVPHDLSSRLRRSYSSVGNVSPDYVFSRHLDDEKCAKPLSSNKSYRNLAGREPEIKYKLPYCYDRNIQDVPLHHSDYQNDVLSKPLYSRFEDEYDDEATVLKALESALDRKLKFGSKSDLDRKLLYEEGVLHEKLDPEGVRERDYGERVISGENFIAAKSPNGRSRSLLSVLKEEYEALGRRKEYDGGFEKEYDSDKPRITREPVEMKKPEIIVGKVHPEANIHFNSLKNPIHDLSSDGEKQNNLLKPGTSASISADHAGELKVSGIKIEKEPVPAIPQAKWSLLKHKRTIEKLKESLLFEEDENYNSVNENRGAGDKSTDNLNVGNTSLTHVQVEGEGTDVSCGLSEGLQPDLDQVPPRNDSHDSLLPNAEIIPRSSEKQFVTDETGRKEFQTEYQDNFSTGPQIEGLGTENEVYEDNEESYPESYYEQPPKSDYSRNIVSNVILEEDESEINMDDNVNQNAEYNQLASGGNMGNECEQAPYVPQKENVNTKYNEYDITGTEEIKQTESQYRTVQSGEVEAEFTENQIYGNDGGYDSTQPPGEYIYKSQDMSNYDGNNGHSYATGDQYQGSTEPQYYEPQQSEEINYDPQTVGLGMTYQNNYDQNYENNVALEQYNVGDGAYQHGYVEGQETSYYNEVSYENAYYQNQPQEGGEFAGDGEQNLRYSEDTAYQNTQSEVDNGNNLPLRQSNLAHLLESDSESFQIEHGSAVGNEDSDFDFSMSQQQ